MKLRAQKILHLAASETREHSRCKTMPRLRTASAMRRKVDVSHLKRCLQRKRKVSSIRVPTSRTRWEKCLLRFSRQRNPATHSSEMCRATRKWHRFTRTKHGISFSYQGCKAIGSRWVFRAKENHFWKIKRFKMRLVAKELSQNHCIKHG